MDNYKMAAHAMISLYFLGFVLIHLRSSGNWSGFERNLLAKSAHVYTPIKGCVEWVLCVVINDVTQSRDDTLWYLMIRHCRLDSLCPLSSWDFLYMLTCRFSYVTFFFVTFLFVLPVTYLIVMLGNSQYNIFSLLC